MRGNIVSGFVVEELYPLIYYKDRSDITTRWGRFGKIRELLFEGIELQIIKAGT